MQYGQLQVTGLVTRKNMKNVDFLGLKQSSLVINFVFRLKKIQFKTLSSFLYVKSFTEKQGLIFELNETNIFETHITRIFFFF